MLRNFGRFNLTILLLFLAGVCSAVSNPDTITIPIFQTVTLHFQPDSASKYAEKGLIASDNGRILSTKSKLPSPDSSVRIFAHVILQPIYKDERTVFDRWDRAGNIRLAIEGKPDLEIMRFMTSYGGRTEHETDVSYIAPLLQGEQTFRTFIDTWTSPGWIVSFSLRYETSRDYDNATWATPVYYNDSFNQQDQPNGAETEISIPDGLKRVAMIYFTTGHCTDGTNEDEFVSKANVIRVDGNVVERFYPWRDDCRQYRERNPYTSHWADGSWSSDYSRSGWCPGCEVKPYEIDLSDALTTGKHSIKFAIERMRPKNEKGDFGYWRVSAYLVGWDKIPNLWQNR